MTPPRWNGQPAPKNQAQVDVLGRGDDTFVEHDPYLRRQRGERPLADLITGARRRSQPRISPAPPGRRSVSRRPTGTPGLAGLDQPAGVVAHREPIRERRVHRLRRVQGNGWSDQRQERHGTHRQSERIECPVSFLDRRAFVDGGEHFAEIPGEEPIHHEPGPVADQHAGLLQLFTDRERGCQRRVASVLGSDYFEQRHHRHRVEEMHSDDPLGPVEARGYRTDRERGRIRRQHRVRRDHSFHIGEDLLLHRQILEYRLEDEIRVGERVQRQRSRHKCGEPVCGVRIDPASRVQLPDLLMHLARRHGPGGLGRRRSGRPGPGAGGPGAARSGWPSGRHPRRRPWSRAGLSDGVGRADRTSGPFLDEVERVQSRPQFVAHHQVDNRVGFRRGAGVEVSSASLRDQLERLIRRRGTAVQSRDPGPLGSPRRHGSSRRSHGSPA